MTVLRYVRARSRPARTGATALVAASVVVATLFATPPASAHNVLIGSTPEDGSTITTQPGAIELVFDQPVQDQFAQVAVLDADENGYETSAAKVDNNTVTQEIADLPDGDYTVSFRIVSADGHPVPGTFAFTMAAGRPSDDTQPDDAQPTDAATPDDETATPATPAAAGGSDDGGTNPALIGGIILAAAAVVGVGILIVHRRTRRTAGGLHTAEPPGLGETETR